MKENKWVRLLAYITGLVNQELLVWSKYSNVLKPWVMSSRAERLWENVTRQTWGRVTLCYFRLGMLFPG